MSYNKIKAKLQDKNSFTYMAYVVLKSKLFSSAIMFLSSILVLRTLSKEEYGLYVLTLIWFAFFELMLGNIDASLTRFIPTSGKLTQHKLIATVLSIKTAIMFFIISCFVIFYDTSKVFLQISNENLETYYELYIIVSVSFLFKYITTTAVTIINAFMLYDLLFKLTILNSMGSLFIAGVIWFYHLDIVYYVLSSTLFAFIYSLVVVQVLSSTKKVSLKSLSKYINLKDIKYISRDKIIPYSLPLFGVGMLSYIKNYLPSYLFGTMISLETLAVFNILKKLTDFLHKGYAGFIQGLYPKLFKMMHSKSKAIDKLFWIGFGIRVVVFIAMYFSYDLILSIYNITEGQYDRLIFITLLSVYMIMYFATFSNLIIMSDKNTKYIFNSSLLQFIMMIAITYYLYYLYGTIGIIISILIVRLFSVSLILYYSNKIFKNKYLWYMFGLVNFGIGVLYIW